MTDAERFDTHPDYQTSCPPEIATAALGRRRVKEAAKYYDHMTMADLAIEKAIDHGSLHLLDGAWGPRETPVHVAADFGLRLTDQVISNSVVRGTTTQAEAEALYITIGHPPETWRDMCNGDTLRALHQSRAFVLSETPELFNLDVLWEIGFSVGALNLGTGPEAFTVRTTAEMAYSQVTGPFSADQVDALRRYQSESGNPVRCGGTECSATGEKPVLDVRTDALRCPTCGEKRSWAWRAMLNSEEWA